MNRSRNRRNRGTVKTWYRVNPGERPNVGYGLFLTNPQLNPAYEFQMKCMGYNPLHVPNCNEVIEASKELLTALDKLFNDPTFQSVFLFAGKHGVCYEGQELNPYINYMKELLGWEEDEEDPVMTGDDNTEDFGASVMLFAGPPVGGTWPRDMKFGDKRRRRT